MLKVHYISRNLDVKLKFFGLELNDLFGLGGVAIGGWMLGQLFFAKREIFGLPMGWFLFLFSIGVGGPALMALRTGKPPGYAMDLLRYHMSHRRYCGCEPDSVLTRHFISEMNDDEPPQRGRKNQKGPVA